MSERKQITDFPNISREDTVSLTLDAANSPNEVEFRLDTASSVTWWKALELRSQSGALMNQVETQDANHGPRRFSVPAANLVGARLTLAKAKAWGIHTGMYEIINLSTQKGRSLQFLWQRDDDQDGAVLGFFRDLGNGINLAADAVADVVETVVNIVEEYVTDIFELMGTALKDFFNWVGNGLAGIPFIGGALKAFFHWLGSWLSAVFDFAGILVKALIGFFLGSIIAGLIRIIGGGIGGLLAWDGRVFVKGINDLVSGFVGMVLAVVGKLVVVLQTFFAQQWNERPLTRAERSILRMVYRGSVALYNVRVVDGSAGVFDWNGNNRAFTLGNTIYMKSTPDASYTEILVHECGHVWQYQNLGTRYIADAFGAMAFVSEPYSWEAELARGSLDWTKFNREAQAQFLQDVFGAGTRNPEVPGLGDFYFDDPIGTNVSFKVGETDFTDLALESVAYVRGGQSWRLSGWF